MDWRKFAFDWNRARAFLVTAEEGSFSAAARALGQSQPTLGRQVSALEEELGVALFERVGHGLVLTETGLELVEQVRQMSEAAARFSLIAAGQSQSVDGLVRVAASQAVTGHLLGPVLETFVVAQLRAELDTNDCMPRLFHLRTEKGRQEIDVIAEVGAGKVIAIEIKASAAPDARDARHLQWLRDELGDRFVAGIILHTGPASYTLGDLVQAAPISTLWA